MGSSPTCYSPYLPKSCSQTPPPKGMGGQAHLECLAEVGGELDTDDGSPVVSNHHHRVERVEGHMGQLGTLLLYH